MYRNDKVGGVPFGHVFKIDKGPSCSFFFSHSLISMNQDSSDSSIMLSSDNNKLGSKGKFDGLGNRIKLGPAPAELSALDHGGDNNNNDSDHSPNSLLNQSSHNIHMNVSNGGNMSYGNGMNQFPVHGLSHMQQPIHTSMSMQSLSMHQQHSLAQGQGYHSLSLPHQAQFQQLGMYPSGMSLPHQVVSLHPQLGVQHNMSLSMGHMPMGHMQMTHLGNPMNLSVPSMPLMMMPAVPVSQGLSSLAGHSRLAENNMGNQSQNSSKKTKRDLPDWIQVFGDACHSARQLESGADLSKVKKKYKIIGCMLCRDFNPSAPWATLKSRKFETENFVEHERSSHHIKAILKRSNSLGESPPSHILEMSNFQQLNQAALNTSSSSNNSSSQNRDSSDSEDELDKHNSHVNAMSGIGQFQPSLFIGGQNPLFSSGIKSSLSRLPVSVSGSYSENKSKISPPWLHSEGKLCHSDKQLESGKDLSGIKKKYKRIMCTFCAENNLSSPWATMKTRKYESSVLNEHERSHHHRKALNIREMNSIPQSYDGDMMNQLNQVHSQSFGGLHNYGIPMNGNGVMNLADPGSLPYSGLPNMMSQVQPMNLSGANSMGPPFLSNNGYSMHGNSLSQNLNSNPNSSLISRGLMSSGNSDVDLLLNTQRGHFEMNPKAFDQDHHLAKSDGEHHRFDMGMSSSDNSDHSD